MKTCIGCNKPKPESEFGKYAKSKDGLNARCKPCKRDYEAKWYETADNRKLSVRQRHQAQRAANKAYVREILENSKCVDCGISEKWVLDFDHVRDTKRANVATMVGKGYALDAIKKEIAKCEVRCSNCHRIVTAKRAGWEWAE